MASVFVEGDAVDGDGVAEQVEVLTGVAHGVGASEPEGVVEEAVGGFGVVASGVEPGEVGVGCWDRSDVLGANLRRSSSAFRWRRAVTAPSSAQLFHAHRLGADETTAVRTSDRGACDPQVGEQGSSAGMSSAGVDLLIDEHGDVVQGRAPAVRS
ncbi:MAG: hypothetical protein OEY23_26385, partial [Acidimicrobiia bacterium]|nr:hypothetical protein [Acidimicrobiia bacterium]